MAAFAAEMYYAGSMGAERTQLNAIDERVTKNIGEMEKILEALKTSWQDSKSGPFLAESENLVKQIKSLKEESFQQGNGVLSKVESTLSIYAN